jgi:ATP-dependent Clp protease ATP-binding subunit ClpC
MAETASLKDEVTENVLLLAREEARRFNHPYVGAEHLVLGMIAEGHGVAAQAIGAAGVTLDSFRERVESAVGRGSVRVGGEIDLTPRIQSIVDGVDTEVEARGDHGVDTGHLLLALIHDGGGIARRLFRDLGVDIDELGRQTEVLLGATNR